jgi:hypothetical protein
MNDEEQIPQDAPVETPESDPRAPNAPDPQEREVEPNDDRQDSDGDDDVTHLIEEAFE